MSVVEFAVNQSRCDRVFLKMPPVVGAEALTVAFRYSELSLLRFLASSALFVAPPATSLCVKEDEDDKESCEGLSPRKGDTAGGYDVFISGQNFGGADFGPDRGGLSRFRESHTSRKLR